MMLDAKRRTSRLESLARNAGQQIIKELEVIYYDAAESLGFTLCMMRLHIYFSICLLGLADAGQKKYCSVCRALVSEVEWSISQVDPKKSIQVGSFRVDPKGNQKVIDKQYARSELHIEEIIESVCDNMSNNYAWLVFDDGTGQMVRTIDFTGERLDDKGFKLDREKGRSLKYQCDNFLEDYEEELILLFQSEKVSNYEKEICALKLEVCSMQEVSTPLFTLPKANEEFGVVGDSLPDSSNTGFEDDKTVDAEKNEPDSYNLKSNSFKENTEL